MLLFTCDYLEGAHEKILQRLAETNLEKMPGYENDPYCISAAEKIRAACECPEGSVFFTVGGTQTNAVVISTMLQSCEGVLAADTGHVNVHEAGAIEYTGHKVLPLPAYEGKMKAPDLKDYLVNFYKDPSHEHMVIPGMVYLSYPTEYGTLYTKKELTDIYQVCREYQIPLYVDGARLGYGLMSAAADLTLPELARLCDVFYIGGTKVGALCGEAVVFPKGNEPKYFITKIKQRGAMLAKGRLLGVQFDTLFTDGLYFKISAHAIGMAEMLKRELKDMGYTFYLDSPTNQQFLVLTDQEADTLTAKGAGYDLFARVDENHVVCRFCTSWATREEDMRELLQILKECRLASIS